MASVNDFGGTGDNLDSPALGGTTGWAAAVASALDNSDTTVNSRIQAAAQSVSPGSREFLWSNPPSTSPSAGFISVATTTGQNRIIRVSKTDADGLGVSLAFALPGDTITITDDPTTPPVTGFSRYVVLSDVTDAGTFWQVSATRTDTTGALAPAHGVRVRAIPTLAAGGGGLNNAPVVPGMIVPYAGAAAPAGWLICDGSAVSRTTYPALFTVCGVTYGVGDGSTTFNIPNLEARFPVGKKTTQTEFNILGKIGGALSHIHALGDSCAAALEYSVNSPYLFMRRLTSAGAFNATVASSGGLAAAAGNSSVRGYVVALLGDTESTSNLPPYLTVNYIIRAI